MVERKDPRTIAVPDGDPEQIRRFIEGDFKIRSGLCPNDCGLMTEADGMQECPKCHFVCNTPSEKGAAS